MSSVATLLAACVVTSSPPASAQVLAERSACQPTTSAKSRDGNCMACRTGPISTRPSFIALVEKVRARSGSFDDIDRRIDTASSNPEVAKLLQGRNLARALYGTDGDFIAAGNASRCLLPDNDAVRAKATAIPCDQIPRDGLAVLLTAGQSNISNKIGRAHV